VQPISDGTAHSHSHSPISESEYYQPIDASDIPEVGDGAYVVDRLIAENEVTSMFGLPKSGKSYLALKLALDVVNGKSFFDLATLQGDVLYIDAETKRPAWRRRVGKIVRGLGCDNDELPKGLKYMRVEKGAFSNRRLARKILDVIHAMPRRPVLTIIDSFQYATGVDPFNPQAVTKVFGYLADFGTVLMIDHERAPRQGDDKQSAKAYGSIYKVASVDAHFHVIGEVSGENEKRVTIEVVGSRDDAPLPAFGAVASWSGDKRSVSFQKCAANQRLTTTDLSGKLLALLQAAAREGGAYERQIAINQCGGSDKAVANAFTSLKKKRLVDSLTANGMTIWFAKTAKSVG
jgi:hypothetical protein